MARINLLPWREQLREERKKRFVAAWVMTILLSIGMIFIADLYISNGISYQQNRNQYLQNEINILNGRISEIKDLRKKKEQLLERMEVIQNLQGNRPVIVRVFDQLTRVVPEGIYFKDLKLKGDKLTLVGMAESNGRISALMRNFDASDWFTAPNMTAVRRIKKGSDRMNEFDLSVTQVTPAESEEEK